MTDEPIDRSDGPEPPPALQMIAGAGTFACEGDACALPPPDGEGD